MPSIRRDIRTPDSVFLSNVGKTLVRTMMGLSVFTLAYGVFALLYLQVALAYLRKKREDRNWAQFCMFLTSTITFVLATVREASQLAYNEIMIHATLVEYQDIPLIERSPLVFQQLEIPDLLGSWMDYILFVISDGVIVWRVFALVQRRKRIIALPVLMLLGTTALMITTLMIHTLADEYIRSAGKIALAGFCLSLATNIVVTAMFAHVLLTHRKFMTTGLGKHGPTQVERALAILVESGVGYCLVQVAYFTIGLIPVDAPGAIFAAAFIESLFAGISAIYPTAVIVLVNSHRTMGEMYSVDIDSRPDGNGVNPNVTTALKFEVPDRASTAETSIRVQRGETDSG